MKIEHYDFGLIVIDGKRYTSDVIIYPDQVNYRWWRKEGHQLILEDIRDVLREEPEVVVVGTGQSGLMKVSQEVQDYFKTKGIKLIVDKTEEACEIYNKLESKKKIAALHLTC